MDTATMRPTFIRVVEVWTPTDDGSLLNCRAVTTAPPGTSPA